MFSRIRPRVTAAVGLLLTVAAAWLWAHEGHQALPSKGARLDASNPNLLLVTAEAREALGVQTEEVVERGLSERLVAPASVVAPWQAYAFATSQLGGQITAVHVHAGQTVKQGQLLGEIQSLVLEGLHLAFQEARNEARLAGDTLADLKTARDAVSPQALAEAEARHTEAQNTVDLARRKLVGLGVADPAERADSSARSLPITSPITGVVSRVHVQVGRVIEPAHHLFEVLDTSAVWVKTSVLERDLARVGAGLPVTVRVTAYPADGFQGTLRGKSLALDPQTHQGMAWADFANPAGATRPLLPGMFGKTEIELPARGKRLTVPADAVIRDGAEHYVLVETGPGQYLRQFVAPGRRTPEFVEIRGGRLIPGDRVVTVGAHELARFFGLETLRLSPEAVRHLGLRMEPVRRRPIGAVVQVLGEVEFPPDRRAVASARLAGIVQRILVEPDQPVAAGDVIAEVSSLELQDLQLELLRSHLKLLLLEQIVERLRPLAEQAGVLTLNRRQWREAQSAHEGAKLRRDSFRARLEAVGLTARQMENLLEQRQIVAALPVRAPITGQVVHLRAPLGQVVKAEDALVEIHDPTAALVRGFVPERQLAGVRVGQKARVRLTAEAGWIGDGEVVRGSQDFQTSDRALSVWVRLKELPPRPLRHGLLATVTLLAAEAELVPSVPRDAILREGTDTFVFVRKPDETFERRQVETGRSDDLWVEITGGLQLEEEVAAGAVAELQTGFAALR